MLLSLSQHATCSALYVSWHGPKKSGKSVREPALPSPAAFPAAEHQPQCVFEQSASLGETDLIEDQPYDVVTCMFAMHYFFINEAALDQFLRNVSINLKNGEPSIFSAPHVVSESNTAMQTSDLSDVNDKWVLSAGPTCRSMLDRKYIVRHPLVPLGRSCQTRQAAVGFDALHDVKCHELCCMF